MLKFNKKEFIGFVFTVVFGSVLHFVYDWTNQNPIVGIFSSVNESTWEHLKLLFFPAALFSLIIYFTNKNSAKNYITVKAISILAGMASIVIVFYTYAGVVGRNFMWADIFTFIIGAAVIWILTALTKDCFNFGNMLGIIILFVMTLFFIIFTFSPLSLGIFESPVN